MPFDELTGLVLYGLTIEGRRYAVVAAEDEKMAIASAIVIASELEGIEITSEQVISCIDFGLQDLDSSYDQAAYWESQQIEMGFTACTPPFRDEDDGPQTTSDGI